MFLAEIKAFPFFGPRCLPPLPVFAECSVRKTRDECEKGIGRSSRLPKTSPTCTECFGEGRVDEQISIGGYASAGFAEAVKMPLAEAWGASLHGDVFNTYQFKMILSRGREINVLLHCKDGNRIVNWNESHVIVGYLRRFLD